MSHTPGPWHVIPKDDKHDILMVCQGVLCRRGYPVYIARVYDMSFGILASNGLENANLIAAAPDMEDVCNKVAGRTVEVQDLMRRENIVLDNLDDRMQKFAFTLYTMLATDAGQAEAAIAKAKGEEP